MRCFKCGFTNKENMNYCTNCGEKLEPLACKDCQNEFESNEKYCGKCGATNEFYIIDRKTEVKPNRIMKKSSIIRHITFGVGMFMLILSFVFTFGAISKTNLVTVNYEFAITDNDVIEFNFNQSSLMMYKGYFGALFKGTEEYSNELDKAFEDAIDDYGYEELNTLTAKQSKRLFSSVNVYGLSMVLFANGEDIAFSSSIEHFIEVLLLIVVQLLPLITIGVFLYYYLSKRSIYRMKYWFLISGLTGLLLSFSLTNLIFRATRVGYGLTWYIIIMFACYIALIILEGLEAKTLFTRAKLKVLITSTLGFVLIAVLSTSFMTVKIQDSNDDIYRGEMKLSDTNYFLNHLEEDFEYISSEEAARFLNDANTTNIDIDEADSVVKYQDFSPIYNYRFAENPDTQKLLLISTMVIATITLVSVLCLQFTLLTGKKTLSTIFSSITMFFIVLDIILSVVLISMMNYTFKNSFEEVTMVFDFGLALSLVLVISIFILNLVLNDRKKEFVQN